mmetsp:Transcript_88702/g.253500  ORF Transcript_88702/g.253500 Transcript_88702/m.253500 type:complete len:231 (+) Transcript_88702:806-1498(+)
MPTANTGGRYMYNEIAKMTLTSYEGNRQVANYLAKKLKSKNHNVKWKVLLIIKHVALKGSPSFKRDMMRDINEMRECITFTGPPDPLRGDSIYVRVVRALRPAGGWRLAAGSCLGWLLDSAIAGWRGGAVARVNAALHLVLTRILTVILILTLDVSARPRRRPSSASPPRTRRHSRRGTAVAAASETTRAVMATRVGWAAAGKAWEGQAAWKVSAPTRGIRRWLTRTTRN